MPQRAIGTAGVVGPSSPDPLQLDRPSIYTYTPPAEIQREEEQEEEGRDRGRKDRVRVKRERKGKEKGKGQRLELETPQKGRRSRTVEKNGVGVGIATVKIVTPLRKSTRSDVVSSQSQSRSPWRIKVVFESRASSSSNSDSSQASIINPELAYKEEEEQEQEQDEDKVEKDIKPPISTMPGHTTTTKIPLRGLSSPTMPAPPTQKRRATPARRRTLTPGRPTLTPSAPIMTPTPTTTTTVSASTQTPILTPPNHPAVVPTTPHSPRKTPSPRKRAREPGSPSPRKAQARGVRSSSVGDEDMEGFSIIDTRSLSLLPELATSRVPDTVADEEDEEEDEDMGRMLESSDWNEVEEDQEEDEEGVEEVEAPEYTFDQGKTPDRKQKGKAKMWDDNPVGINSFYGSNTFRSSPPSALLSSGMKRRRTHGATLEEQEAIDRRALEEMMAMSSDDEEEEEEEDYEEEDMEEGVGNEMDAEEDFEQDTEEEEDMEDIEGEEANEPSTPPLEVTPPQPQGRINRSVSPSKSVHFLEPSSPAFSLPAPSSPAPSRPPSRPLSRAKLTPRPTNIESTTPITTPGPSTTPKTTPNIPTALERTWAAERASVIAQSNNSANSIIIADDEADHDTQEAERIVQDMWAMDGAPGSEVTPDKMRPGQRLVPGMRESLGAWEEEEEEEESPEAEEAELEEAELEEAELEEAELEEAELEEAEPEEEITEAGIPEGDIWQEQEQDEEMGDTIVVFQPPPSLSPASQEPELEPQQDSEEDQDEDEDDDIDLWAAQTMSTPPRKERLRRSTREASASVGTPAASRRTTPKPQTPKPQSQTQQTRRMTPKQPTQTPAKPSSRTPKAPIIAATPRRTNPAAVIASAAATERPRSPRKMSPMKPPESVRKLRATREASREVRPSPRRSTREATPRLKGRQSPRRAASEAATPRRQSPRRATRDRVMTPLAQPAHSPPPPRMVSGRPPSPRKLPTVEHPPSPRKASPSKPLPPPAENPPSPRKASPAKPKEVAATQRPPPPKRPQYSPNKALRLERADARLAKIRERKAAAAAAANGTTSKTPRKAKTPARNKTPGKTALRPPVRRSTSPQKGGRQDLPTPPVEPEVGRESMPLERGVTPNLGGHAGQQKRRNSIFDNRPELAPVRRDETFELLKTSEQAKEVVKEVQEVKAAVPKWRPPPVKRRRTNLGARRDSGGDISFASANGDTSFASTTGNTSFGGINAQQIPPPPPSVPVPEPVVSVPAKANAEAEVPIAKAPIQPQVPIPAPKGAPVPVSVPAPQRRRTRLGASASTSFESAVEGPGPRKSVTTNPGTTETFVPAQKAPISNPKSKPPAPVSKAPPSTTAAPNPPPRPPTSWSTRHWRLLEHYLSSNSTPDTSAHTYTISIDDPAAVGEAVLSAPELEVTGMVGGERSLVLRGKDVAAVGRFVRRIERENRGVFGVEEVAGKVAALRIVGVRRKLKGKAQNGGRGR